MLRSIADNSKKKDPLDKNSAENNINKRKDVVDKKVPEDYNKKKDTPDKSIGNLDKIASDTTDKNQQTSSPTPRKNVPPFLLTFEIFNRNVHNCMVDSGASSNVMPLSVCQKINADVKPSDLKIIQLDITNVTVVGELKYVLIRLSSNPKVHQVIDIVVVDIPEVYGMFLSRDWSEKLHGYFSTDWSHLWLPVNGQPNKLRINREHYLKYTVTDLNDSNEPFVPSVNALESQGMNTFFGNFVAELSTIADPNQQSEISVCTQVSTSKNDVNIVNSCENDEIWSLYFDGSKSREGVQCWLFIDRP
jgi:hypothetical protein